MRTGEMKSAINRGIKLLDKRVPDWRNEISLEQLYLGDSCNCILGQLYDDYGTGLDELWLSESESGLLGFSIPGMSWWNTPQEEYKVQYNRLTQLWKEALS